VTLPKPLSRSIRSVARFVNDIFQDLLSDGPVEQFLSLQPGDPLPEMVKAFQWPEVPHKHTTDPQAETQILLHLHYPDLWPEFAAALGMIPGRWGLVVTLTDNAKSVASDIEMAFPGARIFRVDNRGRDCGPFFRMLEEGVLDHASAVLKIHGKRSLHQNLPLETGDIWRQAMVLTLIQNAESVLARATADPTLGIVGPGNFLVPNHRVSERSLWFDVRPATENLFLSRGLSIPRLEFFAGTMFWIFRPGLDALRALNVGQNDFEDESRHSEASMAHVIERSIVPAIREAGCRVGTI
jgi:lipopolysaccharide biosynthesis protein